MTDISVASTNASAPGSLFETLERQPPDALLALIGLFRNDPRADKIDMGVGVFRDDEGLTPVLRAVKKAEAKLLETQPSKSYLGPEGDVGYVKLLEPIVFGAERVSSRLVGMQTPGGTGALRLAAELIRAARPNASIWVGLPTWPNHVPIFKAAGVGVRTHPFFDVASQTLLFDEMIAALGQAQPGDVVLLHGCSHNPTGAELSADQWQQVIKLAGERGLIPLIDLAYQGLGHGLNEDAAGLRLAIDSVPEVLVAYSCDKNFGLYRERVGALWAHSPDADTSIRVFENLMSLARANWSMPPDHGAAIVRTILEDDALRAEWRAELDEMRARILDLRAGLSAAHPRLVSVASQTGMFSMLPISPNVVAKLREDHGIYMAGNGRINVAGLHRNNVPKLVAALTPYL